MAAGPAEGQKADQVSDVPVRFHPVVLVKRLSHYEVPRYPTSSLRDLNAGLAALDVAADAAGKVTAVNVYIAPDEAIKRSVEEAVLRWEFRLAKLHGIAHPSIGRLVIYFRCNGGSGTVVIPGITE